MKTEMNDRIKLAEAMGWTLSKEAPTGWIGEYPEEWWKSPSGNWNSSLPFDPYTDANDCHALITHLNESGWIVNVDWSSEHSVKVWRFRNPDTKEFTWQGDNWMHGICELALKVIG